jgi:quinol monooxygenase YgiN
MPIERRDFLLMAASTALCAAASGSDFTAIGEKQMYGLIGKIVAVPEKRDELTAILLEGTSSMPGCLSYIVAKDASDANAIWVTEVWDSKESHRASLSLPVVQQAIAKGKPLIGGFASQALTEPVGGHGLMKSGKAAG